MSFSCEKHGDMIISIEEGSIVIKTFENENHSTSIDSNYSEILQFFSQKHDKQDGASQIIEFKSNCFGGNASNTKRVQIQLNKDQYNIYKCNCGQEKQPKKGKEKKIEKPKVIQEKKIPQQNSDSKTQQKQSKMQNQVNEDIRIFEDKIKQYTTEVEDAKKRTPKIPTEWIKKIGFQKKKK